MVKDKSNINIQGFSDEDIIYECNLNLLNAITKCSNNKTFHAYAYKCIINTLNRLIRDNRKHYILSINNSEENSDIEYQDMIIDSTVNVEFNYLTSIDKWILHEILRRKVEILDHIKSEYEKKIAS